VTICTQDRKKILGEIINVGADSDVQDGLVPRCHGWQGVAISARFEMTLSSAGRMVEDIYCNLPNEFTNIILHEYIIMPNHLHGIIQLQQADIQPGLPKIIQSFKRHTTIEYTKGVKNRIYPPFDRHIWQRGYYDHIIRNEYELLQIREYILNNPAKWQEDKYFT